MERFIGKGAQTVLEEMRKHEAARISVAQLEQSTGFDGQAIGDALRGLEKTGKIAIIDDEIRGKVAVYLRGFEGKGDKMENGFAEIYLENARKFGAVRHAISPEEHRKHLDSEYGWLDTGHLLAALSAVMLVVPKGARILGIGSGGEVAQFLELAGYVPTMTDNTPEYIEAGKRAGLKSLQVEDARTLPGIADRSFDALVMDHFIAAGYPVLSKEEERQVMESIRRVLVPGGYLITQRTDPFMLAELLGKGGEIIKTRLFPGSILSIARLLA